MALITTSDYKTYAGIATTNLDSQLAVIIPAAQVSMERFCNRAFEKSTFTEYHNGSGTDVIIVRNPPIGTLTSITIYRTVSDTGTLVDSTLYTNATDDTGIIRRAPTYDVRMNDLTFRDNHGPQFGIYPCWPKGFRNLKVVYDGGYTSGSIPSDLKLALFRLLDILINRAGKDAALSSESLGSYAYSQASVLMSFDYMKALARPFRRMIV